MNIRAWSHGSVFLFQAADGPRATGEAGLQRCDGREAGDQGQMLRRKPQGRLPSCLKQIRALLPTGPGDPRLTCAAQWRESPRGLENTPKCFLTFPQFPFRQWSYSSICVCHRIPSGPNSDVISCPVWPSHHRAPDSFPQTQPVTDLSLHTRTCQ